MSCSSSSGSEDDEGVDSYRKGGYHAVRIGDHFAAGRYVAQRKLGWGQFSTVWLAYDTRTSVCSPLISSCFMNLCSMPLFRLNLCALLRDFASCSFLWIRTAMSISVCRYRICFICLVYWIFMIWFHIYFCFFLLPFYH